jgi:hypothetical protein
MILDLNALAVESFETDPGAPELMARPPYHTDEVILCAGEDTGGYLAGGPTREVILC